MSDTKNVKLGVCSVSFGGVDLGYTSGGVEVEVATDTKQIMVDQFGNSPINEYVMGRTCTVKCPLAETTLENLVAIMPGATLAGGGTKASGSFTFTTNPADADTVTVNGVVFTFKTVPTTFNHVKIGVAAANTIINLFTILAQSIDPAVIVATYTYDATHLNITYDVRGTAGNAFTIAKTATGITASGATLTGGAGSTVARVDVTNGIGTNLISIAQSLVLHPIANAGSDRSEDFNVPLAATSGALQFSYKLDDTRIYDVTFTAYPDPVTKILFKVGDPAAV